MGVVFTSSDQATTVPDTHPTAQTLGRLPDSELDATDSHVSAYSVLHSCKCKGKHVRMLKPCLCGRGNMVK